MNRLAELFVTYRRQTAMVVIVLTAVTLLGTSRLKFDDEPRSFLRGGDASLVLLDRLFEDFGPDDNDVLVVLRGEDLFTPRALEVVRGIVQRAAKLRGVQSVLSVLSIRRVGRPLLPLVPPRTASAQRYARRRREALEHPLVAGHLLSPDATTMLVVVRLEGGSLTVSEVEPLIGRLRKIAQESAAGSGLQTLLAGHQAVRVDVIQSTRREYSRMALSSALVAALIGMAVFRRAAAVLICVAGPAVGVVWVTGLLGLVGEELTGMCAALPTLLFVIGFTDAVHLMVDVRRSRAAGLARLPAAAAAIRHLGLACSITSLTTAIGFGSLVLAQSEVVRRFGLISAGGVSVTLLAVVTVVPLLAATRLGDHLLAGQSLRSTQRRTHWLVRLIRPALERPWLVSGLGTAVSLILLMSSLRLRSDIVWTEAIPTHSQTARAMAVCDREFGGALLAQVLVEWPRTEDLNSPVVLQVLIEIHALFEEEPSTRGPASVLGVLQSLPGRGTDLAPRVARLGRVPSKLLLRCVRRDLRRAVVSAHVPNAGAAALEPGFANLERKLAKLQERYPGFRLQLTGTTVVAARTVHRIIGDLGRSLAGASVVVLLVMTLLFRSLSLGLISVIPNAFPLGAAAAFLVWTGQPLQFASVMTFSMCLGIAVDDTIHFLVRYKLEHLVDGDVRGAIHRTLQVVGTALVTTSVIFVGGFAVMMTSTMPAIRLFAGISCLAIVAALVGDLLILPSLLLCFAPRRGHGDA